MPEICCRQLLLIVLLIVTKCYTQSLPRETTNDMENQSKSRPALQYSAVKEQAFLGDRCHKLEDCVIPQSQCVINKNHWWAGEAFCMCVDSFEPRAGDCVYRNVTDLDNLPIDTSDAALGTPLLTVDQIPPLAPTGAPALSTAPPIDQHSFRQPSGLPSNASPMIDPSRLAIDAKALGDRTRLLMQVMTSDQTSMKLGSLLNENSAPSEQVQRLQQQQEQRQQTVELQDQQNTMPLQIPSPPAKMKQGSPDKSPSRQYSATLAPVIPEGPDATIPPWMIWVNEDNIKSSTWPSNKRPSVTSTTSTTTTNAPTTSTTQAPSTSSANRPYFPPSGQRYQQRPDDETDVTDVGKQQFLFQQEMQHQREIMRQQKIIKLIKEQMLKTSTSTDQPGIATTKKSRLPVPAATTLVQSSQAQIHQPIASQWPFKRPYSPEDLPLPVEDIYESRTLYPPRRYSRPSPAYESEERPTTPKDTQTFVESQLKQSNFANMMANINMENILRQAAENVMREYFFHKVGSQASRESPQPAESVDDHETSPRWHFTRPTIQRTSTSRSKGMKITATTTTMASMPEVDMDTEPAHGDYELFVPEPDSLTTTVRRKLFDRARRPG